MPFNYQTFDVDVVRQVKSSCLSWPEPGQAMDERNLGGNRMYSDLRYISWETARRVSEIEEQCIKQVEASPDPSGTGSFTVVEATEGYWELEDLLEEIGAVAQLDVGVASTVAALSATGCIPFTSCSAGAFGGLHYEKHPLVVFYARPEAVPLLVQCAQNADVGLENEEEIYNPLIVYSDDIRKMRDFANALSEHSADFRRLRRRGPTEAERQPETHYSDPRQMGLNL